eukprot:4406109-Karenia_brevis.AAC.1
MMMMMMMMMTTTTMTMMMAPRAITGVLRGALRALGKLSARHGCIRPGAGEAASPQAILSHQK